MRSFCAFVSLISFCVGCQTLQKKEPKLIHLKGVHDSAETISSAFETDSSSIGYVLYDPILRKRVESHNETQDFIPASTQKLATLISSLQLLGPDYRFKTTLFHSGVVKNGVLYGDLYLKGYGDPSLGIRELIDLQEKMRFKKIEGRFYYDESFLIASSFLNPSFNTWAPYNPGISALSSEFNVAHTFWKRKTSGEIVLYSVPDFLPYTYSLANSLGSPETFFIPVVGSQNEWTFHPPHLPFFGFSRIPVHEPGQLTAQIFQKLCELRGVELPDPERAETPKRVKLIASVHSAKLIMLAAQTLEYSNNLAAELIGLVAAREATHQKMTPKETFNLLSKGLFLQTHFNHQENFEQNQSGLSSQFTVKPVQLISVLKVADRLKLSGRSFESLLPVSGYHDGIHSRLSLPHLAFRIRAKTGSEHYVKALAGYLYSKTGRRFLFAILQTEFTLREALNRRGDLPLRNEELGDALSWKKNAERQEEVILSRWIEKY